MKIKDTIERDCCHPIYDLKPYRGLGDVGRARKFCVHCGQQWEWDRKPGEMDGGLEQIEPASVISSTMTETRP